MATPTAGIILRTTPMRVIAQSLNLSGCLLLAVLSCTSVAEGKPPKHWWTGGLFLDNDLFAGEDDGYTNGIRLSFVSPNLSDYRYDKRLPGWLRSVNDSLKFIRTAEKGLARNMVVTLGQQMYTPNERYDDRTDLIESDRPYAGWLYLGFGYQMRTENRLETAVLNLGMIGPSAKAEESQDFIHELRGLDTFEGWDNQLGDEPGLQFLYTRKNVVYKSRPRKRWGGDVITQWGGSLGNVATHLETGAEFRLGWDLPYDFGTSSASPGGDNSAPGSPNDPRLKNQLFGGAHVYVAINGRWSMYDITLDGNTFKDSHQVNREPLVGSLSMGVVVNIKRVQLGFSRYLVTKEFEGQAQSRGYGTVSLSYTYAFD